MIKESLAELEAVLKIAPAHLAPFVELCVKFAHAADAEVEEAEARVAAAEKLVADVKPHVDQLAKRADRAERDLALREELDVNERARQILDKRRAVVKREGDRAVEEAVAGVAEAVEARNDLVEKFVTCHTQVSPSLIECREKVGRFTVKHADGRVFAVCESRAEALKAVDRLLEREKASQGLGRDPHLRDEPQAGETADAEPTAPRRRRRQARLT